MKTIFAPMTSREDPLTDTRRILLYNNNDSNNEEKSREPTLNWNL